MGGRDPTPRSDPGPPVLRTVKQVDRQESIKIDVKDTGPFHPVIEGATKTPKTLCRCDPVVVSPRVPRPTFAPVPVPSSVYGLRTVPVPTHARSHPPPPSPPARPAPTQVGGRTDRTRHPHPTGTGELVAYRGRRRLPRARGSDYRREPGTSADTTTAGGSGAPGCYWVSGRCSLLLLAVSRSLTGLPPSLRLSRGLPGPAPGAPWAPVPSPRGPSDRRQSPEVPASYRQGLLRVKSYYQKS